MSHRGVAVQGQELSLAPAAVGIMADCAPEPARMQSKQWSTSDLMRGAGACAEIAGIDLNKLSREELVNMLKDVQVLVGHANSE